MRLIQRFIAYIFTYSNCPNLSFIPQSGYSDLVCSCDITFGIALRKANELVTVLREVSD